MSTAITPIASFALFGLSAAYSVKEYYLPLKDQHAKDKERIRLLEEEIVRLKREMRICGVAVPPCSLIPADTNTAYENHQT